MTPISLKQNDKNPGEKNTNVTASGTVLLVDDEEIIRQLGSKILEKAGFEVIVSSSGSEGVNLYRQHHDKINVAILDISMPGLDGIETMLKIKEEFPEACILISTGHSIDGNLADYIRDGMCDILQKPYRAQQLTSKVNDAIKK